jgi:hypothetical protein
MKDLFGNETNFKQSKKKIHAATKKEVAHIKSEVKASDTGLNSVYKDFGNYIQNRRGNKTL